MAKSSKLPLWLWYLQISTNLSGEEFVNLSMPGHGCRLLRGAVDVHGMVAAFAQEFAAMRFQVPDEVFALHAADSSTGSRITS